MSQLVRFRREVRRRSLRLAKLHKNSESSATKNTPPASSRKRRRLNSPERNDWNREGSTCPICMDLWEKSGQHRLSALQCGHLFGESCIRRWFASLAEDKRCCPTCQAKSRMSDIRYIYARCISTADKSEINRLQQQLQSESWKVDVLNAEVTKLREELASLRHGDKKLKLK